MDRPDLDQIDQTIEEAKDRIDIQQALIARIEHDVAEAAKLLENLRTALTLYEHRRGMILEALDQPGDGDARPR